MSASQLTALGLLLLGVSAEFGGSVSSGHFDLLSNTRRE